MVEGRNEPALVEQGFVSASWIMEDIVFESVFIPGQSSG